MTRIGFIGGGQLARMAIYAGASRLGLETAVLDKEEHSPAGQLTRHEYVGWVDDDEVLGRFAEGCDVITLENEFVDTERLAFLESLGKRVVPHSQTIGLIQDKLIQKQTLNDVGIPTAPFVGIDTTMNYEAIVQRFGDIFVLKTRKMGYDGYGNALVHTRQDFDAYSRELTCRHPNLLAEEYIPFDMELAVMVARTSRDTRTYPVVQTIQENHVCHTVLAPAPLDETIQKRARELAVGAVEAVKGYGLYGVEMFLSKGNQILVNEMAPRPHNSGHYTIEACITSQFENFLRAVLDLPLGSTEMVQPYAVMMNLLGKQERPGYVEDLSDALRLDDVHIHVYGKAVSRLRRKMGHLTVTGMDLKELQSRAKEIHRQIVI